jgi:uncharacterized protein involved in type VI secretion and phage assembly
MGLGSRSPGFRALAWNYDEKKSIEGKSNLASSSSGSKLHTHSLKASGNMYGEEGFINAGAAKDMAAADGAAKRASEGALGSMVLCKGVSINAEIATGSCVEVTSMDQYNGKYFVTAVTHTIEEGGAYFNEFDCVPLDIAFPASGYTLPPITEIQSAIVVDNNDDMSLGRVKVKFPTLDQDETPWLRVATAGAGPEHGLYVVPEIDSEVLVAYEHGDARLPIVLGTLWNGEDVPPPAGPDPDNKVKTIITRSGNEITFTDDDGSEEIKISQKDGKNTIVLGVSGPSISIESDGDISIKGKTITLESTQADVKITSKGKAQFKSTADFEIKAGMNLKAEGSMNAEVKGGVQTKVEGGAMTEVKGGIVKIN